MFEKEDLFERSEELIRDVVEECMDDPSRGDAIMLKTIILYVGTMDAEERHLFVRILRECLNTMGSTLFEDWEDVHSFIQEYFSNYLKR